MLKQMLCRCLMTHFLNTGGDWCDWRILFLEKTVFSKQFYSGWEQIAHDPQARWQQCDLDSQDGRTLWMYTLYLSRSDFSAFTFFLHKFVIFCVPNSEVMQDASSVTLLQTAIDEACSLRVLWLIVRSSLMRLCLLRLSNVLSCTQGTYVPSSAAFSRRQIAGRKSPRKCSDCQWHSQMLRRGHAWHWTSMKCFVALPKPFAPGTLGSLRLLRSLKLQIGRLKQTDRFQTCVY